MPLADNLDKSTAEYGDYQTPIPFALKVCKKLAEFYKLSPDIILEPTFGTGNFLTGAISSFPNTHQFFGIEIDEKYYEDTAHKITNNLPEHSSVELFHDDVFSFDFSDMKERFSANDSILIIGNPPWATNSQLTSMGSGNLPLKSNFKGCSGWDAITGKGNFDIAEYIILQLLSEFANSDCTLAMLCKTIVAKNIIRDIDKYTFSISQMDLFAFDANEIFGVNCDAGLLVIRLGRTPIIKTCSVYEFSTDEKVREFGWIEKKFYSNVLNFDARSMIDGKCQIEWRQGLKHDCSKIMELKTNEAGLFENGIGDAVNFQLGRFVYPLVKSSDIKTHTITKTRKYVIVPQKRVNEDTGKIREQDSIVWMYLQKHETYLSARKSAIYKKAPKYAIFGIGDYSFSKYKVGISGFYKEPVFALLTGHIPIMMDDTCYFLSFDTLDYAIITLALLNSPECTAFLKSIAFLDSKRPYTKDVLQRIDLEKLSRLVDFTYIKDFSDGLPTKFTPTAADYERYRALALEHSVQM